MKLLYVDACARAEASRTRRLAETFLNALDVPGLTVTEHRLYAMNLRPVDGETLARRELLCDRMAWDDPMFGPARELREADAVLIAAPYWDLSFPSALKVWVENVHVRNLLFRYEADRCVGLCRAREAVYLSTAGGFVGGNDWGGGYMKAALGMLGVPSFTAVYAEGLDLDGRDAEQILRRAEDEARRAARGLADRLSRTAP